LDRKVDELVEAEHRSAELLAARAAALEARSVELDSRAAQLEERAADLTVRRAELEADQRRTEESETEPEPEETVVPVVVAGELRTEQERLEAKARTLEEAEQRIAEARVET